MGKAQKEVKIIKSKNMNLAVRVGELKHLLYIPQPLASQEEGLLLNRVFIHMRLVPLSLEANKDGEI